MAGFVGTTNVLRGDLAQRVLGHPGLCTVRPESIRIAAPGEPVAGQEISVAGQVRDILYLGADTRYVVGLADGNSLVATRHNVGPGDEMSRPGTPVQLVWQRDHVFELASDATTAATSQQRRADEAPRTSRSTASPPARTPCPSHTPQGDPPHEAHATARRRRRVVILAVAACGSDSGSSGGEALKEIGEGEGALKLVAWAGYAEDGSTDPAYNWVGPFEEETGCQTDVKIGNTSDEMFQLMSTGEYDGVSASGDASVRLIDAGEVAPVNMDLISNYPDLSAVPEGPVVQHQGRGELRRPPRLGRQPADVEHRRREARPRLLGVVFDRARPTRARSPRMTRRSTSPTPRST